MEQDAPLKTATDIDDLVGGRGSRNEGAGRRSRASDDRSVTENRELTDAERLEMFQRQNFNDVLPDLPKLPGFHLCWLTTTNPRDSIPSRLRLGYELLKAEELPGFEHAFLKTGEYVGCIGVAEMVAAKLPMSLYQMYMRENHHDAPARQAEGIAQQNESLSEQIRTKGGRVEEEEGMSDLRHSAPARGAFAG